MRDDGTGQTVPFPNVTHRPVLVTFDEPAWELGRWSDTAEGE
jgi:hypothetical protein